MSSFDPETEYITTSDSIRLKEFHDYSEEFVTRPPYQRKAVWSRKKQQCYSIPFFNNIITDYI